VSDVSFNIGQQNAVNINNVAGDQTIEGGQTGSFVSIHDALANVEQIRRELDASALAPDARAAAAQQLDGIEHGLKQPTPDRASIGESLTRLTKVLVTAGALATGTSALLNGLSGLAGWLGHFGGAALKMLKGAR